MSDNTLPEAVIINQRHGELEKMIRGEGSHLKVSFYCEVTNVRKLETSPGSDHPLVPRPLYDNALPEAVVFNLNRG